MRRQLSSQISSAVTEVEIGAEDLEDDDDFDMDIHFFKTYSHLLVLSMLRRRRHVQSRRYNLGRAGGRTKDT